MEIKRDKGAEPASRAENSVASPDAEKIRRMTNREFLDSIKPTRYKRFAPRRRVFRFRLPFTYDYE